MRGTAVVVPVLEQPGAARLGRFGWKNQHASLVSFSADAYLNEMGITSPLFPDENTSSGRDVTAYDPVPDPEDDGVDVVAFANFMRSTKAPSRGPITADVQAGEAVVQPRRLRDLPRADAGDRAGGHRRSTAAPSRCREALGSKIIHPYSDFLTHDIGTGDGIPILPTAEFADTRQQDAHRAAVGAAHPQPADARRPVVHQGGGHPAASAARRSRCASASTPCPPTQKAQLMRFLESL